MLTLLEAGEGTLIQSLSSIGSAGAMGGILLYLVRYGIPAALRAIEQQGIRFTDELKLAREQYRADLRDDRTSFKQSLDKNTSAIDALKEAINTTPHPSPPRPHRQN